MKKIWMPLILIFAFTQSSFCQNLSQTLRGQILDADSELPLIGVSVILLDSNPLVGTTSDENGKFRIKKVQK